jgi:hypothetical protein
MERSDYLALLNRAILNIDQNTPEARSRIYDRARHALLNRLETMHPRLSNSAIDKEQRQLEDAIQQLELLQKTVPGSTSKGPSSTPQPSRSVTSREIFCEHCVAETTDRTPGDVSTINGIGRKFYGSAAPCPECASVIRTLWWTVVEVPIVPLASYRYKTSEEGVSRSRFWCRELPARHWEQIWKTWAIGLVAGVAAVIGIYLYSNYQHR